MPGVETRLVCPRCTGLHPPPAAPAPLKELLAQLPQDCFRQVHRSTVVNLAEVAAAVRDEAGRVSLRLKQRKETLPVSRVFAEQFRQM